MKKVLFLGCNHDQVPYLKILSESKEYHIVGTDMNEKAPGRILCDSFFQVGYADVPALLEIGHQMEFGSFDRVFTAAAQFAHFGAASFAANFGIAYPRPDDIQTCLDKGAYYRKFLDLGIPLPRTGFVQDREQLNHLLAEVREDVRYYLKSDFGKNPNYIYVGSPDDLASMEINWTKDRYFRYCYILQEEMAAKSLRVNVYGDRFNIYEFESGKRISGIKPEFLERGILATLHSIMNAVGLQEWLVKFDVLLNEEAYAVIDIGLDPPFRMVQEHRDAFFPHYLDQYLNGKINYPADFD